MYSDDDEQTQPLFGEDEPTRTSSNKPPLVRKVGMYGLSDTDSGRPAGQTSPEHLQRRWEPRLPPAAKQHYRPKSQHPEQPGPEWRYSASMNGWVRRLCMGCRKPLTNAEEDRLMRAPVPLNLKKDWVSISHAPTWKTRVAPLCSKCIPKVLEVMRADPQVYNGRGQPFYIIPMDL